MARYTDPTEPSEKEAKLPMWAQDTINGLRRRLAAALDAAEEARLSTDPDESDTVVRRFGEGDIGLGASPTIRFRAGTSDRDWVNVRIGTRGIYVMGDRPIAIHPSASNTAHITLAD